MIPAHALRKYTKHYIQCIQWYEFNVYSGMSSMYTVVWVQCIQWYEFNVYSGMSSMYTVVWVQCIQWYEFNVYSGMSRFDAIQHHVSHFSLFTLFGHLDSATLIVCPSAESRGFEGRLEGIYMYLPWVKRYIILSRAGQFMSATKKIDTWHPWPSIFKDL